MKSKILKVIEDNPTRYSRIILKDSEMHDWVLTNSIIDSISFREHIYSAVYEESDLCKFGNKKKLKRFSTGFINCGPANKCICTKEQISTNVSLTKLGNTTDQKIEINKKRKHTMIEKYGVEFNSQRPEIKSIWNKQKVSTYAGTQLNDIEWLNSEYNIKQRSLVDLAEELNVYYGTVAEYCKKHGFNIRKRSNYSMVEKEIIAYIQSKDISCEHGNWDLIGKEIDILVPDKNIGIEVNGLYWHSFNPSSGKTEDKRRHINKTLAANENKFDIIHITDYEWKHKNSIIKSIINSKLGITHKLHARRCVVKEIDKKLTKQFLNDNHLQGYINSDLSIGLFYDIELVGVMSFGKSRFSKLAKWELLRFCSKLDTTIVGGGSKMLKLAQSKINDSIVSYCDLNKGNGNSYEKMGFVLHHISDPGYFWTDGTNIFSRYKCQKKQLSLWLPNFDNSMSEQQNMFNNNYRRFWDCGNKVFLIGSH